MSKLPANLGQQLEQRKSKGLYRQLPSDNSLIDFCSNDYLGFATSAKLKEIVNGHSTTTKSGSTGSRLITGNTAYTEELEKKTALYHKAEAALIFNSGYDANIGLISCIAQKQDLILLDELSHASIYDGIRLSFARHYKFRHNDIEHLRQLIDKTPEARNIFIVVESVYSMDGDCAPLKEISTLLKHNVFLIVDEAHATGVFGEGGRGLCNETAIENNCFARIITYGKAMGSHGAAIVGSADLRNYLINYARSFIYTTALPLKSLYAIEAAYDLLASSNAQNELQKKINLFKHLTRGLNGLIESSSAIQCLITEGNKATEEKAMALQKQGFHIKAIKSPTVPEGKERIRICLHNYNTDEEIKRLAESLVSIEM